MLENENLSNAGPVAQITQISVVLSNNICERMMKMVRVITNLAT